MTEVFTPQRPEKPGYYWWRRSAENAPEPVEIVASQVEPFNRYIRRIGGGIEYQSVGLFGPEIPFPVAPCFERIAVYHTDGALFGLANNLDHARNVICGEPLPMSRVVCVPVEIVNDPA